MPPRTNGLSFAPPAAASPFGGQRRNASNLFAPSVPSRLATSSKFSSSTSEASSDAIVQDEVEEVEGAVEGEDHDDEADASVMHFDPPVYPRNGKGKWKEAGRTMMAAVCPIGGEVASWITQRVSHSLPSCRCREL